MFNSFSQTRDHDYDKNGKQWWTGSYAKEQTAQSMLNIGY